ncbi:hypothetical protein EGK01_00005, partial [Klebsiella pneumoniae]
IPSGVRHFTARQLGIRDITVLAEYGLEMLFHTIPRPINIDAKRANRVVEIKMLAMAVPQKVRMQIIRHGVG